MSGKKIATVIGGGVGGCGAAIRLAKYGWKVTIYEKNQLLCGTSCKTPGRMGLGFHYVDLDTSVMLLKATIRFAKEFPGLFVGKDLPFKHPLRRGRYFIAKDSLFTPDQILSVYHRIKEEYEELIKKDPTNMVFGPPEDFFRILSREEYEKDVTIGEVSVGVETAEQLLDWNSFEGYLLKIIKSEDNIIVKEQAEVISVKDTVDSTSGRFEFMVKCGQSVHVVVSNYVVNSTWSEQYLYESV